MRKNQTTYSRVGEACQPIINTFTKFSIMSVAKEKFAHMKDFIANEAVLYFVQDF